jgi:hypothetical protein
MMDVVAAGVIDGKMLTERSCIVPASTSCWKAGSRPVRMAGQTTWGVAASMTTRRIFTGGGSLSVGRRGSELAAA